MICTFCFCLEPTDTSIGLQVRGPANSSKDARKQQQKYAAAKEARNLLGLLFAKLSNGTSQSCICWQA